jgi:hypothetical protein
VTEVPAAERVAEEPRQLEPALDRHAHHQVPGVEGALGILAGRLDAEPVANRGERGVRRQRHR